MEIDQFELSKEQVGFLRSKYSDIPIVQKILAGEKDLYFEVTVDDGNEFWDWLTDESVMTMTEDYEATEDTLMIESIIDIVSYT